MSNTNFDDLKRLRDEALVSGRGSKAYFAFCDAVFDGFPKIYETAKSMNTALANKLSEEVEQAE